MIPKFREWDPERQRIHGKGMSYSVREEFDDSVNFRFDHEEDLDYTTRLSETDRNGTPYRNLMMSTGLKDKNGVEIFEGDIVKVSVHNGFDYYDNEVCVVRKSRFHSGLVCINPNNDMECRIFNQDVLEDYQYEVIGNIYENPELLEVE